MKTKADEKLFVDWAGTTVPIYDSSGGPLQHAHLFVAVLGASSYTYAEATGDEQLANWISAHLRAFEFCQGVPKLVVPDNTKAGVAKASRYDPDLNPRYREMAMHYGVGVVPAQLLHRSLQPGAGTCGSTLDAHHRRALPPFPRRLRKSFVARALAQKGCRDGYSALYTRAQSLFRDLAMAHADGSLRASTTSAQPRRRIGNQRLGHGPAVGTRTTRLLGDLRRALPDAFHDPDLATPVSRWHEQIGDPTLADGILDRLVHNAHRIEMRGDSMRKNRGNPNS